MPSPFLFFAITKAKLSQTSLLNLWAPLLELVHIFALFVEVPLSPKPHLVSIGTIIAQLCGATKMLLF
jgi:hypothetical protein